MKSNKEYHFQNGIESVVAVVDALQSANYDVTYYRKCELDGRTISYRLLFNMIKREYEVTDLEDCLKIIVNDAVMLGALIRYGTVIEG